MTTQPEHSLYSLMSTLAQSGECMDCYAIELKLLAIGCTEREVSEAMSDADDRKALLALCIAARTPERETSRLRDAAAEKQTRAH